MSALRLIAIVAEREIRERMCSTAFRLSTLIILGLIALLFFLPRIFGDGENASTLGVEALSEVIRDLASSGTAVLFSSHQLDLVEDLCEEIAIIDHGRVVVAGRIADLKAAAPRRRVEVEIAGADGWDGALEIPGAEVVARQNGRVQLSVGRDVDPASVLALAQRAGHVVHFAYEPPTLPELFVEAVRR